MEDLNPVGFPPHENPLEQRIEFFINSTKFLWNSLLHSNFRGILPRGWTSIMESLLRVTLLFDFYVFLCTIQTPILRFCYSIS
jgi:hypothetical protein